MSVNDHRELRGGQNGYECLCGFECFSGAEMIRHIEEAD